MTSLAQAETWARQGRMAEALAWLETALAEQPETLVLWQKWFFYALACPELTQSDLWSRFQQFSRLMSRSGETLDGPPSRDPYRRLRVGYLSGDFCQHAAARVFSPLFEFHDPAQFEVVAYATTDTHDALTDWFRGKAAQWRCLAGLSDAAAAQMIRADQLDLLVDLAGHSQGSRLTLLGQRLAPLQINAGLGLLSPAGLSQVDYRLADAALLPEALLVGHPEEVVYLSSHLHWAPPEILLDLPLSPPPHNQRGHLVLGSANRSYKLNAQVLDTWAEILRALPTAQLWLKCYEFDKPEQRAYFTAELQKRGILAERLVFKGQTTTPEHLLFWNDVDLALDPFPYQGGLTTFESLFMGVPVVSLDYPGGSRGSVSILANLGLNDLIAPDRQTYVELAVTLAQNPSALMAFRQNARAQLLNSDLFDGLAYTREIENAYRWMWLRWCSGDQRVSENRGYIPAPVTCPSPLDYPEKETYLQSLLLSAQACFRQGRFAHCEVICHEILQREPQSGGALHLLGLLAFQFGYLADALQLFARAAAYLPDQADLLFNWVRAAHAAGETQEVTRIMARLQLLQPDWQIEINAEGVQIHRETA